MVAAAGMLSGTATVLIWHNLVKPLGGVFAIYELLPAFIISLLFIGGLAVNRQAE